MYEIPVKIEGIERRKRSTGLLHIVAGFFLIANAGTYHQALNYEKFYLVLPVYIVALLSLVYGFLRKHIDPSTRYNNWVRLAQTLIFAVLMVLMIDMGETAKAIGLFLWVGITLLLVFTERRIFQQTALSIMDDGIHVPGNFKDHVIPWQIIEELVLRPDYITILRKDKKYVQLELLHPLGPAETDQINAFSQRQIAQFSQPIIGT